MSYPSIKHLILKFTANKQLHFSKISHVLIVSYSPRAAVAATEASVFFLMLCLLTRGPLLAGSMKSCNESLSLSFSCSPIDKPGKKNCTLKQPQFKMCKSGHDPRQALSGTKCCSVLVSFCWNAAGFKYITNKSLVTLVWKLQTLLVMSCLTTRT